MENQTQKYNKDFEFTLLLNDNIIVKRNFDIIGFNQKATVSNNFREAVDYATDLIKSDLRKKSIQYMLENINSFYVIPGFDTNDSKDVMTFQVTQKGRLIAERKWDATIYPARIRYTVNIKPIIFEIITKIQKTLSTKSVSTSYLGYSLV
jgi:hypothetical protein